MRHGADGAVLDVGRKTRTVPPSIRRALQARDRTADSRAVQPDAATRITCEHWIDGGSTSLDNLVLLCRRHHRAVHEGGFELRPHRDGTTAFLRPNGTVLEAAPATAAASRDARPQLALPSQEIPVWDGTPFDVAYAIDVLYRPSVAGGA